MKTLGEIIRELCEDNDLECRDNYSGRGMYGRTCYGIVTDNIFYVVITLCDMIRDEGYESAADIIGEVRTDSMGLDKIVYFPSITE